MVPHVMPNEFVGLAVLCNMCWYLLDAEEEREAQERDDRVVGYLKELVKHFLTKAKRWLRCNYPGIRHKTRFLIKRIMTIAQARRYERYLNAVDYAKDNPDDNEAQNEADRCHTDYFDGRERFRSFCNGAVWDHYFQSYLFDDEGSHSDIELALFLRKRHDIYINGSPEVSDDDDEVVDDDAMDDDDDADEDILDLWPAH